MVQAGQTYIFTPTGSEFQIAKVGDKNVSWYVGFDYKSGGGKNVMKMAHTSIKRFERGITNGSYTLKS